LVQENYREEKICYRRHEDDDDDDMMMTTTTLMMMMMMMMGIIIQNFRRKSLRKEAAWKTLRQVEKPY